MASEIQKAACEKQKGEEADTGLRKPVKWRILEVDWNNHGLPCNEQTKSEGSIDNIKGNLNHCHYLGKDASSCGPKLSRKDIHAWVEDNWGKHVMIKFLPKDFFVVIFLEEEDRDHIISLQNWFLDDHPLYIQPWSPNFDPTSLVVYVKPVWIQLYNLLIGYWSEACLETLGRSLGTLLEIDEDIVEGDLYTYARLKTTVVKTIPSSVMLLIADGEWKHHIEVEKEISACSRCGSKLHSADKCKLFVRKVFNRPHRKPKQVWKVWNLKPCF
ncbi:hypothetical protein SUGI_0044170 [Cryptomeria japonica]|nr:hypothetical protein SUGI_0044170 [Cryptomeria japonica]